MRIWRRRNEAHPSKKLRNSSFRGEISFGIQLQTFSWHCVQENSKTKTWRTFGKKLIPTNLAVKLTNTSKNNRSVSNFFLLYLNNNWGHCPRLVCISASVQFFLSPQARKLVLAPTGPPTTKTITAVNRVEHQRTVNLKKTWTRISGFQVQSKNNFINACEEKWKTHKKWKYIYLHRENSSTEYNKSYG